MRRAAAGGVVTFVGAMTSAGLGFLLSVLLARTMGTAGAGIVFQAIAVFTITLSITRLGLDTTAVWLLPRLVSSTKEQLRPAVAGLLVPALVASTTAALGWYVFRAASSTTSEDQDGLYGAVDAVAAFLPAAALMGVCLAAVRALGDIVAFNAIDNILVPTLRLAGVILAVMLGGATTAVSFGWAVPWFVGAVAASLVLLHRVRSNEWNTGRGRWPGRALRGQIRAYAFPRAISTALEQSIIWLDVILVGLLAGSAAAGVYGSASRFVAAGVVVSTALRIVVAPRFSALLAQRRLAEVQSLYAVTARWILLFGSPVYVILAVFAPTVLNWLGDGFGEGATAMMILCVGSVVVLAAGNVQALLLMSGRSGLGALNKAVVLLFNVLGNLILVPKLGISGAALAWAGSMVLDTILASIQVRVTTRISISLGSISYVVVLVVACVAVPSATVAHFLGQGAFPMLVAVGTSGVALLAVCILDRDRLRLVDLVRMGRTK